MKEFQFGTFFAYLETMRALLLGPIWYWTFTFSLFLMASSAQGLPVGIDVLVLERPVTEPIQVNDNHLSGKPYYCTAFGLEPIDSEQSTAEEFVEDHGSMDPQDGIFGDTHKIFKEHLYSNFIQRIRDKYSMLLVPDLNSFLVANPDFRNGLNPTRPGGLSLDQISEFRDDMHKTRRRLLTTLNVQNRVQDVGYAEYERRLQECEECYQDQSSFNSACTDFKRNLDFFRALLPSLYTHQERQTLSAGESIAWRYNESRIANLEYSKDVPIQTRSQGYSDGILSTVNARIDVSSSVCHQPEGMLVHVETARSVSCTFSLKQITNAMVDTCSGNRAQFLSEYVSSLSYECANYLFSSENKALLESFAVEYFRNGYIEGKALDL